MNYNNIFLAHFVTKQAAILHGSSGYGKSSTVQAFAREYGFRVVEKRTCYTDPIEVMLPVKNDSDKLVDFWPSRWLSELTQEDCPKTVLFLDEFNRPSSTQTFSMFTELLLDRSINGMKISDNVLILGACNLGDEDTGVMEIPDAVLKRVTNLAFVPDDTSILVNMRNKLATEALKLAPKILSKPGVPEFKLNGNPRQIDAVCSLWSAKHDDKEILDENDLAVVARGRIGLEAGNLLASTLIAIKQDIKFKLPRQCVPSTFEKISECEQNGMALEVMTMLKDQCENPKNHRNVTDYLLRYATPEVCRSIKETNLLTYTYPKDEYPVDKDGRPFKDLRAKSPTFGQEITKTGEPWHMTAIRIGKLVLKAAM